MDFCLCDLATHLRKCVCRQFFACVHPLILEVGHVNCSLIIYGENKMPFCNEAGKAILIIFIW